MMPQLASIYDAAFFEEWGSAHPAYVESARRVAAELFERFRPASVADLGCGCGVYSRWFLDRGVRVLALDGVEAPPERGFGVRPLLRDLTVPLDEERGPFDLTLCLEVAEHIPEPLSEVFLRNITSFGDLLALSAAPPNQGGHHHVNERPKRYWVRRLAALGWEYDRKATGGLVEGLKRRPPAYAWMGQHVSIYRRGLSGRPLPLLG